MNTLSDEIDEWFTKGSIASGEVVSENQVSIVPGAVENFGFHFLRELIPFGGGLRWRAEENGTYTVSFRTWDGLTSLDQEAFTAFVRNSTRQVAK